MLGCVEPVLTLASLLSQRSPFVQSFESQSQRREACRAKVALARYQPSDHLALLNAYDGWTKLWANNPPQASGFAREKWLSVQSLHTCSKIREQFRRLLESAKLLATAQENLSGSGARKEARKASLPFPSPHSRRSSWLISRASLTAGLFPRVLRRSLVPGRMGGRNRTELRCPTTGES